MTANPDLRARLEVLEEIVAGLGERLGYGQDPVPPGPWVWHRLGSAERIHRMNQLRAWVDWLTRRYNLHGTATRIAPCWYRHPVAVEELTALWVAWQAAYTLPDPTAELIAWHDRWLWPCLHRLNSAPLQLFNSCAQRHKEAALVAPTTDSDDFADFLGTLGQQPPSGALGSDTTRGRRSGLERRVPVTIVQQGARRYLVAPYGPVSWVLNAWAAGEVLSGTGVEDLRTGHRRSA